MTVALAIDTATEVGSVALSVDGVLMAEVALGPRVQGRALAPAIQHCLDVVGLLAAAVDTVVVGDGPGSFTGLRIGWATAQGFVEDRAVTVEAVPSMMALAWGLGGSFREPITVFYDALRGEVYGATYEFTAETVTVRTVPTLGPVEELQRKSPRPWIVVGEGAVKHGAIVEAWTGRPPLGPPQCVVRAGNLLAVRRLEGASHRVDDISTYEPDYGRPAEAQARWERARGRPLGDP